MYMLKSRTLPVHAMSNVHIQSLVSLRESKIMQLKFKLYMSPISPKIEIFHTLKQISVLDKYFKG